MNRISGDLFEYYVARTLRDNGIICADEYTADKITRLESKIKSCDITIGLRVSLVKKLNIFLGDFDINKFALRKDCEGRKGDATDIRLLLNDKIVNLSLKHNNISVKHQRPSSLNNQLSLQSDYSEKYAAINDKWYKSISKYNSFNKIPKDTKFEMYAEFNILYAKYINENQKHKNNFINFLISNNIENKFILEWSSEKNILNVYNCKKLKMPTKMIATVETEQHYLKLEFIHDGESYLTLRLRIHNASSAITNKLSLKYDTKIENIKNIYENYEIIE